MGNGADDGSCRRTASPARMPQVIGASRDGVGRGWWVVGSGVPGLSARGRRPATAMRSAAADGWRGRAVGNSGEVGAGFVVGSRGAVGRVGGWGGECRASGSPGG